MSFDLKAARARLQEIRKAPAVELNSPQYHSYAHEFLDTMLDAADHIAEETGSRSCVQSVSYTGKDGTPTVIAAVQGHYAMLVQYVIQGILMADEAALEEMRRIAIRRGDAKPITPSTSTLVM